MRVLKSHAAFHRIIDDTAKILPVEGLRRLQLLVAEHESKLPNTEESYNPIELAVWWDQLIPRLDDPADNASRYSHPTVANFSRMMATLFCCLAQLDWIKDGRLPADAAKMVSPPVSLF